MVFEEVDGSTLVSNMAVELGGLLRKKMDALQVGRFQKVCRPVAPNITTWKSLHFASKKQCEQYFHGIWHFPPNCNQVTWSSYSYKIYLPASFKMKMWMFLRIYAKSTVLVAKQVMKCCSKENPDFSTPFVWSTDKKS